MEDLISALWDKQDEPDGFTGISSVSLNYSSNTHNLYHLPVIYTARLVMGIPASQGYIFFASSSFSLPIPHFTLFFLILSLSFSYILLY